ncbi:MAG TPA: hypothetical protein VEC36_00325, partial [Patescibacteria group bacterium]|nr:hypothetical protein [Patescibacteria group bacterium]
IMLVHFDDLIAEDEKGFKAKIHLMINHQQFKPDEIIPTDLTVENSTLIDMKGMILQADVCAGLIKIECIEPDIKD